MSWADLFERADRYEPTVDDVCEALARHRDGDGGGETEGSQEGERGQEDGQ